MKHFGRNNEVQIKAKYCVVLIMAVITILVTSVPVHASKMDNRIELFAKQSYVFKVVKANKAGRTLWLTYPIFSTPAS